ncbi:MAG: MBOAT family protein [Clostridium sp.]|nr:MBOAT family protein [Clostridium sp.]
MILCDSILSNIGRLLAYDASSPMLFSSGVFWALFLVFLPAFAMLRQRLWQMLGFVVTFSLYFYYKSSGWFVLMLAGTSLLDWLMSKAMTRTGIQWRRRLYASISIISSLGILAYFKYANFFLWNWNAMVQGNFQPLDIILPVGISFYTFQSVSYIVDVYKGRVKPTPTWLEYAFYLSFFPALVAGPIVRADYFLPQISQSRHATRTEMYAGLWLIIIGVIKKALIADYIAQFNDLVFDSPGAYTGFETLMGVIGYTMQIYCDFSGYSDMAIGLAMIMGFKLAKNFDFPYRSSNLTEFWHRWHISLSTWLRDYVYIPLGGNRKGVARTYINNFLTMLIGGLWHGAAWKFVFWGAMHGAGLAMHKACKPWLDRLPDSWAIRIASWALTMICVSTLWIYFRAASWQDAWVMIHSIFADFTPQSIIPFFQARATWAAMMAAIILAHAIPAKAWDRAASAFITTHWATKLAIFLIVVQFVIEFRSQDVAPFIYFQF